MKFRTRAWILGLFVLAAPACSGLVTPAEAATPSTKPFGVVVSSGPIGGGDRVDLNLAITNYSDQQNLGSANVGLPSAFELVSAAIVPPGVGTPTALLSSNTVQLRDLAVVPGATLNVTATVDATCVAGTYDTGWSATAKQSNNFSGPPGNSFTLDLSRSFLSATVTAPCKLAFVAGREPHNALAPPPPAQPTVITSTDYNDPPGQSVAVEVLSNDGTRRITSSSDLITLVMGPSAGIGTLSGNTVTAGAGGTPGVAEFPALRIDSPGAYRLIATALGLTSSPATGVFRIDTARSDCDEDVNCSLSVSTNTVGVSATSFAHGQADAGNLTLSPLGFAELHCDGHDELLVDQIIVNTPQRMTTITVTIPKKVMNAAPNNAASATDICWAGPPGFAVKSGTPAAQPFDGDGDGIAELAKGILPDCGTPPCVSARRKENGDGIVVVEKPATTQDPYLR